MLFNLQVYAPIYRAIHIRQEMPIEPFKALIHAIGSVECDYDTLAYNPKEEATGYFQIRPIRLDDYNKRTGSSYVLDDMFDYDKAEIVFLYYASRIGPYDIEKVAKDWNGSGKMTIDYWNRVRKRL